MQAQPSESFQNLKVTQVELPPNLYVYGQPVNLHPAYQYDASKVPNPQNFLPVVVLNQPIDPLVRDDAQVKGDLRRSGACFYYVLCALAFLSILGIIRTGSLIQKVIDDDTIPRVVIGFIVCNLIEDFLNIAVVFPAKEGIYRYNLDRMVIALKTIWGAFIFYIVSNVCYIIYTTHYPDRSDIDQAYLAINLIVGVIVYVCLIYSSRRLMGLLQKIRQIQETMAIRAHINT